MNSLPVKILTAVLTFAIGVAVAGVWLTRWFHPVIDPVAMTAPATRLEMVFVLDTTGSMGGLIEGAKQRIWGIVNDVMQESGSSVRIGLVAYRDRADEYVTQVLPLTEDLDKVYTTLMDYKAAGGGDGPEDVRTALAAGLYKAGWSNAAPDLSQIVFLVGDAPPHYYRDAADTLTTTAKAVQKGIIVNTIQCGDSEDTRREWQAIAQRGNGQYFAIASNGGVQTISTPYDEQLGELASRLGATFLPYGFGDRPDGESMRTMVAEQIERVEGRIASVALPAAKAERALNKAISKEAYIGDLMQGIENGSVSLDSIKVADLPQELQSLSPAERQAEIEKRLAARRDLRAQIMSLSKQRDAFIEAERKKQRKEDGFDAVVSKTLKEQMARKKIK